MREAIKLASKGGKISVWVPAEMAYGAEGDEELGVSPNATLYYEIELLGVDKWNSRR